MNFTTKRSRLSNQYPYNQRENYTSVYPFETKKEGYIYSQFSTVIPVISQTKLSVSKKDFNNPTTNNIIGPLPNEFVHMTDGHLQAGTNAQQSNVDAIWKSVL